MIESLPVVEEFHSIQGEGAHTGRSAFFIRLASCKIGCVWCDTKHSWDSKNHPQKSITCLSKNVSKAQKQGATFLVITGGEPLHHNLDLLCKKIRLATKINQGKSIPIHIETSGIDQISGNPDWITLSPKKHAPPRREILQVCQELKVIIHEKSDLVFAEQMANQTIKNNSSTLLFLQPGWESKKGATLAFEYVKNNPQWRLSVQTHKWLEIL